MRRIFSTSANFYTSTAGDGIDLIAKIENRAGVNNLDAILDVSDGIMIGRGDMGVEIPYEELPDIQKTIITACRIAGKRCITATEMLESMIKNPRPTRAEISDVANAVYDGSSAIMLSGETAAGQYPVEAVKAMAKIAQQAETCHAFIQAVEDEDYLIRDLSDALSHSACLLAHDVHAKAIVVCTRTGGTAKMVSRFRPMIDVIGMTTDFKSYQKLSLSWGVLPVLSDEYQFRRRFVSLRKTGGERFGACQTGRHYRHYGRHAERQERQLQPHQHRNNLIGFMIKSSGFHSRAFFKPLPSILRKQGKLPCTPTLPKSFRRQSAMR